MNFNALSPRFGVMTRETQPRESVARPVIQFGNSAAGESFESTRVFTAESADAEKLRTTAYDAVVQSAISGKETKLAFDGAEVVVKPYKMSPEEVVEKFNATYRSVLDARKKASGEHLNGQLDAAQASFQLDSDARSQMEAVIAPLSDEVQHVGKLPNGDLIVLARVKEGQAIQKGPYDYLYNHVFMGQPGQLRQLELKDLGQWGNAGYSGETADGKKLYFPGWGMQDAPSEAPRYRDDKTFNWAQQLSKVLDMPEMRENIGLVRKVIVDGQIAEDYQDFSRRKA